MILIKNPLQISLLREGGQHHAKILRELSSLVRPGITTRDLDLRARELLAEYGDAAAFLGYKPKGAKKPYPAALCVSVNDEVVHGIPSDRILKDGDVVSLDLGVNHQGLFTDAAVTVPVGKVTREIEDMIHVIQESLYVGIMEIKPGNHIGDISYAIEKKIGDSYGIVREFSGHGVGIHIHEDPYIPNYGKKGTGEIMAPGMVLAIEPMITLGGDEVFVDRDGYTVKTREGAMAAHVEHTVLVTDDGYEILTEEK